MNNKNFHRKLNSAFKELENIGYFTAKNFTCCSTHGWAGIDEHKKDKAVFYHSQAASNLRKTGTVYLSWAGSGEEIKNTLIQKKIFVYWNGKQTSKILASLDNYFPSLDSDNPMNLGLKKYHSNLRALGLEDYQWFYALSEDALQKGKQFKYSEDKDYKEESEKYTEKNLEKFLTKLKKRSLNEEYLVKLIKASFVVGIYISVEEYMQMRSQACLQEYISTLSDKE